MEVGKEVIQILLRKMEPRELGVVCIILLTARCMTQMYIHCYILLFTFNVYVEKTCQEWFELQFVTDQCKANKAQENKNKNTQVLFGST